MCVCDVWCVMCTLGFSLDWCCFFWVENWLLCVFFRLILWPKMDFFPDCILIAIMRSFNRISSEGLYNLWTRHMFKIYLYLARLSNYSLIVFLEYKYKCILMLQFALFTLCCWCCLCEWSEIVCDRKKCKHNKTIYSYSQVTQWNDSIAQLNSV